MATCCCTWGAAIGKRHGIPSREEPEFDCADCQVHGGGQDKHRCKRHHKEAAKTTPASLRDEGIF